MERDGETERNINGEKLLRAIEEGERKKRVQKLKQQ